jgi:hypothetical protein
MSGTYTRTDSNLQGIYTALNSLWGRDASLATALDQTVAHFNRYVDSAGDKLRGRVVVAKHEDGFKLKRLDLAGLERADLDRLDGLMKHLDDTLWPSLDRIFRFFGAQDDNIRTRNSLEGALREIRGEIKKQGAVAFSQASSRDQYCQVKSSVPVGVSAAKPELMRDAFKNHC